MFGRFNRYWKIIKVAEPYELQFIISLLYERTVLLGVCDVEVILKTALSVQFSNLYPLFFQKTEEVDWIYLLSSILFRYLPIPSLR